MRKPCQCGCGGTPKKKAARFCHGHGSRNRKQHYEERDCGFATPCWVWLLSKTKEGYGFVIRRNERPKMVMAHRMYYSAYVGPIPEHLQIDHLCRNRACVNPSHLEAVTQATNCRRGSQSKMTMEKAEAVRLMYRNGDKSQQEIADSFGLNQTTVSRIILCQTWSN